MKTAESIITSSSSSTVTSPYSTTLRTTERVDGVESCRSEKISSMVESHNSEMKSEQKIHMKLEHSPLPLFDENQKSYITSTTANLLEQKAPTFIPKTFQVPKLSSSERIVDNNNVETLEQSQNENVETSRIARKDALNFFESITRDALADSVQLKGPKEMIDISDVDAETRAKVNKLAQDFEYKYKVDSTADRPQPGGVVRTSSTKAIRDMFNKIDQDESTRNIESKPVVDFPFEEYKLPPLEIKRTILSDTTSSGSPIHGHLTISKLEAQSRSAEAMMRGFNLVPEPPPEMGFMPKSEVTETTKKKRPESISVKAKQLQESFEKTLSPIDAPVGGVKIFPSPLIKPPEQKTQPPSFTRPPPPFELEKTSRPCSSASDFETRSHISTDYSDYRSQSAASSHHHFESSQVRATSPKPSPQAIAMEKSWARKDDNASINKTAWPPTASQTTTAKMETSSSKQSSAAFETVNLRQFMADNKIEIGKPSVPKPQTPPIIYNAETIKVDHTVNAVKEESIVKKITTECDVHKREFVERKIEESECLRAPNLVRQAMGLPPPPVTTQSYRKQEEKIILEPGPQPEMGYIPPPTTRENKMAQIEKTLEMSLEQQQKIPPCAVRTMPPAPPPVKFTPTPPLAQSTPQPSVFEHSKWRQYESDSEEPKFRHVQAPSTARPAGRPKSTNFEELQPFTCPPPPPQQKTESSTENRVMSRREEIEARHQQYMQQQEAMRSSSATTTATLDIKPGSPPIYVHPTSPKPFQKPFQKPDSPKFLRTKVFQKESGYMADTDEPLYQYASMMQKSYDNNGKDGTSAATASNFTENNRLYSDDNNKSYSSSAQNDRSSSFTSYSKSYSSCKSPTQTFMPQVDTVTMRPKPSKV